MELDWACRLFSPERVYACDGYRIAVVDGGIMMKQHIQRYVESGYVFHGSICSDLQVLVPNEPRDAGSDLKDKETAVYATHVVCNAIMFSLIKGLHGMFEVNRSAGGVTTALFPSVFAEQLRSNIGSLYVLRKDDFTIREEWQLKSYKPVIPVDRIDVCLQDFFDFGGELVFR